MASNCLSQHPVVRTQLSAPSCPAPNCPAPNWPAPNFPHPIVAHRYVRHLWAWAIFWLFMAWVSTFSPSVSSYLPDCDDIRLFFTSSRPSIFPIVSNWWVPTIVNAHCSQKIISKHKQHSFCVILIPPLQIFCKISQIRYKIICGIKTNYVRLAFANSAHFHLNILDPGENVIKLWSRVWPAFIILFCAQ